MSDARLPQPLRAAARGHVLRHHSYRVKGAVWESVRHSGRASPGSASGEAELEIQARPRRVESGRSVLWKASVRR